MTKQRYAWVPAETLEEMSLIVDGRRVGGLIPWKERDSQEQIGWTCVQVRDDGTERTLIPPDSFWTPLAAAQRFLLDAVGLSPVREVPAAAPEAETEPEGPDADAGTVAAFHDGDKRCGTLVEALLDVIRARSNGMPLPSVLGVLRLVEHEVLRTEGRL